MGLLSLLVEHSVRSFDAVDKLSSVPLPLEATFSKKQKVMLALACIWKQALSADRQDLNFRLLVACRSELSLVPHIR